MTVINNQNIVSNQGFNNFTNPIIFTVIGGSGCTKRDWTIYTSLQDIDKSNINSDDPMYVIPNVITPNSDGFNDSFVIGTVYAGSSLKIYNRWGIEVADFPNYTNQFTGAGLSSGVYYFVIR
jgi:gliding motility-associated-like protein